MQIVVCSGSFKLVPAPHIGTTLTSQLVKSMAIPSANSMHRIFGSSWTSIQMVTLTSYLGCWRQRSACWAAWMYVVVSLFHIHNVGIIYSTLWQTTSVVLVSIFQLLVLVTRKNSFDRRYRYLHYHYVLLIDRSLRSPSNYGSYLHSRPRRDCSLLLCNFLHGRTVRPRTLVACRRSVLLL